MRIILKQGVRIFRPYEVDSLFEALDKICRVKKCKYRWHEIFNALLYTGMRYVELQRFAEHPEWFDKKTRSIYLPKEASRKKKRTMPDRYVFLSSEGLIHVQIFIEHVARVPERRSANWTLNKAAELSIGAEGVSVKSFRKTWESWLVVSYPEMLPIILMSQGHTEKVSLKHYLNLPFTNEDRDEIQLRTAGWGAKK